MRCIHIFFLFFSNLYKCLLAWKNWRKKLESLSHCSLQLWFHFLLDFYSKSNLNSHNRRRTTAKLKVVMRDYSYKSLFFKIPLSYSFAWRIFWKVHKNQTVSPLILSALSTKIWYRTNKKLWKKCKISQFFTKSTNCPIAIFFPYFYELSNFLSKCNSLFERVF